MNERRNGSLYAFIPCPLEIKGHAKLNFFPYNVMIAMHRQTSAGKLEMGSVIYDPDFSTFQIGEENWRMKYFSIYNRDYWLEIFVNISDWSYSLNKYFKEELVGVAGGRDWKQFFIQVGMLGLAIGETCKFEEV